MLLQSEGSIWEMGCANVLTRHRSYNHWLPHSQPLKPYLPHLPQSQDHLMFLAFSVPQPCLTDVLKENEMVTNQVEAEGEGGKEI